MSARNAEILGLMQTVMTFVQQHDLPLPGHRYARAGGGYRYDPATEDWTKPVLGKAEFYHFGSARDFVTWCRALNIEKIRAYRRDGDVTLNTETDHLEMTWTLCGAVPRRRSDGRALPGIEVKWGPVSRSGRRGDYAVITVDELVTVLDELDDPR